jgi:hypothetical protein
VPDFMGELLNLQDIPDICLLYIYRLFQGLCAGCLTLMKQSSGRWLLR